jgi:hypothetical protein
MTKNLHKTYGAMFFVSKSMIQAAPASAQMAVFEYMQAATAGLCCVANGPVLSHRVVGFQRSVSIRRSSPDRNALAVPSNSSRLNYVADVMWPNKLAVLKCAGAF